MTRPATRSRPTRHPSSQGERSAGMDLADAVRTIARVLAASGHDVPGFRSPPRLVGVDRSLRRRRDGNGAESAVVSVRVKGRPWAAVLADMIEGVVVANRLAPPEADRVRAALWESLVPADSTARRRVA